MLCSQANDRVTVQTLTRVEGAVGGEETPSDVETLWAVVAELSVEARLAYQQQDARVTHWLAFRGVKEFDFATTQFSWRGRRLRPVKGPSLPGGRRSGWTTIPALDVTDDVAADA